MLAIDQRYELRFQEEKRVLLPRELVVQAHGKTWLKLRPTALAICQLILGENYQHNVSISTAPSLQKMLQARNNLIEQGPDEEDKAQELFDEAAGPVEASPKRKAKKRAMEEVPDTVSIQVEDERIECLVHGQRPRKTDLTVLLEAHQLSAVITHLRDDAISAADNAKRAYKKVRRH